MRKNKGFTLIELLAVILILAIVALIATPIVLNIIRQASENALKNSAYGIIDAAEKEYVTAGLTGEAIFSTEENGIFDETGTYEVKISGKKPSNVDAYINSDGTRAVAVWDEEKEVCATQKIFTDEVIIDKSATSAEECTIYTDIDCFTISDGVITNYDYSCGLSVAIPYGVTGIGNGDWDETFYNGMNPGINQLYIPNSVTTIESYACHYGNLASITIPNSVTTIGRNAFDNNSLTNVTISNSVTTIESEVFSNNDLTNVTIPNSVTTIGSSAFSNNNLTNVTIPNSVTTIDNYAFSFNPLTSITIPNSVTTIGGSVFTGIPSTTNIIINKPSNSIAGSPWGASSSQILWTG